MKRSNVSGEECVAELSDHVLFFRKKKMEKLEENELLVEHALHQIEHEDRIISEALDGLLVVFVTFLQGNFF